MVLSLIFCMFCLLFCVIAFMSGYLCGNLKSTKKFVLTLNLFDGESFDDGSDNEPEQVPVANDARDARVTPIRKDAIQ